MSDRDLPPPEGTGTADAVDPPEDDLLAAEWVLGVLDTGARQNAQRRHDSEPLFAQRVAAWERRFTPWLADMGPVAAPAHVWSQIRLRLGWESGDSARRGLWQSVAFWRSAAALASLAAVVAVWLGRVPSPAPQPPLAAVSEPAAKLVTTLAHDDGSPGWLASVDRVRGTVLMDRVG